MVEPVLVQIREKFPNDVQTVFRHFPLPSHPLAQPVAIGSEAAGKQDKFFEFTNFMFANQAAWSSMNEDQLKTYMIDSAGTLGLDKAQFEQDLSAKDVSDKVQAAIGEAARLQLDHTPYVFVNQNDLGEVSFGVLPTIVELYKLDERMFDTCPKLLPDLTKDIKATIHTTKGDVDVELFTSKAPMTVSSFVFLAEQSWYDNVTFHRVIPGFVAQTGDPTGSGAGGPGYQFGTETHADLTYDGEGLLGMANAGLDTNGSQFFFTYDALPSLDGKHTIFGKVTKGMDVVEDLTAFDPATAAAPADKLDMITGITIHR